MNKKGIHHIEFVIAVSVFIVAVISIIYLMYALPDNTGDNSLSIAEKNFKQMNEISVKEMILNVEGTSDSCYEIEFNKNFPEDNLSILGDGISVNYFIEGDKIDLIARSNYIFYSGEEFITNPFPLSGCSPPTSYQYSIVDEVKFISYKHLLEMNVSYRDDYNSLKQQLNLNRDFAIKITKDKEVLLDMSKFKPLNVEIYAKEFRINIINENGEIVDALVNLQMW